MGRQETPPEGTGVCWGEKLEPRAVLTTSDTGGTTGEGVLWGWGIHEDTGSHEFLDERGLESFTASVEGATEGDDVVVTFHNGSDRDSEFYIEDGSADGGGTDFDTYIPVAHLSGSHDVHYWTEQFVLGGDPSVDTINIPTVQDYVAETTESFKIHIRYLSEPDSEIVLEGDIYDADDPDYQISFDGSVQAAVAGGTVTLTLTGNQEMELEWWTESGTASGGSDFSPHYTTPQSISVNTSDSYLYFTTSSMAGGKSFKIHIRIAGFEESEIVLDADILNP